MSHEESEMNARQRHTDQAVIRMKESYMRSIKDAGGNYKMFMEKIDTMSVLEMMKNLAQNDIMFVHKKGHSESRDLPLMTNEYPEELI